MTLGNILMALLLLAVLAVLLAGVALMGAGGKTNAKYGNRLMVMRVSLQGLALLMLALLFLIGKN